jgi:zona occludens toxin (predicted ATPase)
VYPALDVAPAAVPMKIARLPFAEEVVRIFAFRYATVDGDVQE